MNRRIRKKIQKKLGKSPCEFGNFELEPCERTYRKIKKLNRRIHRAMVHNRHIQYQLKGYGYQLSISRRYRKGYTTAFLNKYFK